ncbi:Ribosomal small subunit pseudouridine synthase A [Symbiodinium microadriaticum]|uniref:Ribosomal small subunit pseudouridine synthase A n=1 Tax=Symbiodinium microadriaticum TaxID=2951 RepID=A0A1Q9D3D3_SYMMI|nr:Ribosomal small subunit pseudouridine synthase A [Symbiodinium microadriaticum]CAE7260686.1 rsuA [Symbiodinium sp. KB8]
MLAAAVGTDCMIASSRAALSRLTTRIGRQRRQLPRHAAAQASSSAAINQTPILPGWPAVAAAAVPLLRCVALATNGSVRAARRQVALGRVAIDGRRAEDELEMVENDRVVSVFKTKRGEIQELKAPRRQEVYIKLHKQRGVVCSHVRELPDALIVSDVYPVGAEDCHCVGRLDARSEGLLLVTTDGFFTRTASMPETHVEKEYVVLIAPAASGPGADACLPFRPPTEATLRQLTDGVDLLDGKALAAALEAEVLQCNEALGLARLRLVVDSGRYHLVRRMMAALGYSCKQLIRTRIGEIRGVPVCPASLEQAAAEDKAEASAQAARAEKGFAESLLPGQYAPISTEDIVAVYRRGLQWLDHLAESRVASGKTEGESDLASVQSDVAASPHERMAPRRSKLSLSRRRDLSQVLCSITAGCSSIQREPREFSKVLHTFGTDTSNWEERRCISRDEVREHFVSPFKHCRTLGDDGPKTGQNHNRSPIVGRKPSNEEILARARRVIISAKAHREMSWDKVFAAADSDKSGALDAKELKQAVRAALRITPETLPDYDLQVLFDVIDHDKSGSVEMSELLEYVSHGSKRPDDENRLLEKKTARVRRNLNLAFRKYTASHSAINELFANIDAGGDGKISLLEFLYFARQNLHLTAYDVGDMELKQFYKSMDRNGDGVDAEELLNFIKEQHAELSGRKVFSFMDGSSEDAAKKEPWKQRNPFEKACASGEGPSCVFVNLGRIKPPSMRLAMSSR